MGISSPSTRRPRLPAILIGGALVALAALLVWRLEWVEKEIDLGPTTAAKRNPFLASQRLLEQHDIPYQAKQGFSGLEEMRLQDDKIGGNDTLLLVNTYQNLHERQVESLWRWVENGGRLIVSLENPYIGSGEHLRDPLLERMGMTLHADYDFHFDYNDEEDQCEHNEEDEASEPDDCPATDDVAVEPDDAGEQEHARDHDVKIDSCVWGQTTVPARLRPAEPELFVGVSGDSYITAESADTEILAGDTDAAYFVRHELGAGEIYAITSATAWTNSNIHCHDNAYAFWRLTEDSNKVWYAINQDTPSFWRHLWQLSPMGCSALLLALTFWLWSQASRFGPILHPHHGGRRQFIDHIRAAAQFTLRHRGSAALVEVLRSDIIHSVQLRQPGFARFTRNDKIRTLHSISGLPEADIDIAMYQPLPLSDAQFLDVVKRLQQLRNRL